MAKLPHNRPICMGDRGESSVKVSMTKAEKKEHHANQVRLLKIRMQAWGDDFIIELYYDNEGKNKVWFQAAKDTLNERKVPKGKPPPPKPHYTRTTISGKDTHLNTFTTESLKVLAEKSTSPTMAEEARKILKTRNAP